MFKWLFDLFKPRSYQDYIKAADAYMVTKISMNELNTALTLNDRIIVKFKNADLEHQYELARFSKPTVFLFKRPHLWAPKGSHLVGSYVDLEHFYETFKDDLLGYEQLPITWKS